AIILLGDAIHPTTPNLGQGGCLAIEDAAVLPRCLQKYGVDGTRLQIAEALRRFEQVRHSRTAAIARLSRIYGHVGQWGRSWSIQLLRLMQSLVPKPVIKRFLREIFEYDARAVPI